MGYQTWHFTAVCLLSAVASSGAIDKRVALDDCLASFKVPVFIPSSSDFTQATKPFNLRVPFEPVAYTVPSTVQHVQDAVSCGVTNKITVTAKSGGHSYGSHGLGGEDGHLIVDMRRFNTVTVDQAAHTAVVGAGGRLGNIALALYAQGKQATGHGTCPGVGVSGLTLHGGYGLTSRSKGLTLDNLFEATVVLANSTVVTISQTQNFDLFWAMRGAGAAFGIVTEFKFKTFTAPENNIVFQYNLSPSNSASLVDALTILQNFSIYNQPPELNMRWFLGQQLTGVYYGNRSSFDAIMTPLLSLLKIPTNNLQNAVSTKGWLDTLTFFSNGPLAQPEIYDYHETFFAKSLMPEYLSPAAMKALADYYFSTARHVRRGWYLLIDLHGGANSAISSIPVNATAYAHRKAVFKMQFYDVVFGGTYQPQYFEFLNGWVKAIEDAMPGENMGMYVNYADTSLNRTEAHRRYWGSNYERLVAIKKGFDPRGVFEGPQLVGG
ncbi:Glucooligosaccharide oxidase [Plenodomus tracheiphilus IPT5]|uniref:Glucooligosaccharide oxidase n=1 Tax=Plenodomus tracheiphilus IPT5 TaxID=1408161 RepID=A0A6A7BAI3_9PLEO|nr:Glucooligosaccharide oxidase [Plenodomus tracheiphilus IPT5]